MKSAEKKLIKKALYNYSENLKTAVISTVEWAESNMAVDYGKVAVKSSPSNYKETQLCGIIDESQHLVRWCYMVEKVLDHYRFEKDKVKFVQAHFFKKKSDVATCMEIGIGRATFFRWQTEILEVAYNWAKELKLIKEQ